MFGSVAGRCGATWHGGKGVVSRLLCTSRSGDTVVSKLTNRSPGQAAWDKAVEGPMGLVVSKVEEAVCQLEDLRIDVPEWRRAFGGVKDIALSSSKHLFRPQLVLLGYAAQSGASDLKDVVPPEGVVEFAAGVELQHLFMFVHDDMMDHALLRRGQDTVQVAIARSGREGSFSNVTPAVSIPHETVQHLTTLVGDVLQAKSSALLSRGERKCRIPYEQPGAVDAVLEGAYRAGAAQFDDILGWSAIERAMQKPEVLNSADAQTHLLLRLLEDKSSFHGFAAPLIAGLRLSGKSTPEIEDVCKRWAKHAGAAFQGIDDVMDLVLEVEQSGKDKLQDIQEGRLSLPLFLLRQEATKEEWARVYEMLGSRTVIPPSDRHHLLKLMNKYPLKKQSLDFVDMEVENARGVLEKAGVAATSPLLVNGLDVFMEGLVNLSKSLRQYS